MVPVWIGSFEGYGGTKEDYTLSNLHHDPEPRFEI